MWGHRAETPWLWVLNGNGSAPRLCACRQGPATSPTFLTCKVGCTGCRQAVSGGWWGAPRGQP